MTTDPAAAPAPGGLGELVAGIDVDRVAAAVAACPDVTRLTGTAGGPATYLPGRRVAGVAVRTSEPGRPPVVAVQVVARYGVPMHEVGDQVRRAVAVVAPAATVDVRIADVDTPLPVPPAHPLR